MKKGAQYILIISAVFAFLACGNKWQSLSNDPLIEKKVDSLLKLMTLDEKIGQMTQYTVGTTQTGAAITVDIESELRKGLVGSLLNVSGLEESHRMQDMAMSESRLKIPVIMGYDVLHGYKTIFPIPLAESCSWNLDLIEETAQIAAEEAATDGIHWTLAPMVDISRDARWGRVMEGAGEDPYLGSLIAAARVKGFQGESVAELKNKERIAACAKHFTAYGAAESGRDYNVADISERTLWEIYMPPFESANQAGVATFMTASNEINGVPCTSNKYLYTDILRKQWGFSGFVVTDYTAIDELVNHGVAADEEQAVKASIDAGVDMEMVGGNFSKYLKKLVDEKRVSTKRIDLSVRRILELKFILGLFDDPYRGTNEERWDETIYKPEFMRKAQQAVRESIVLLKNDNHFFPINPTTPLTIALIGPMVKNTESLNGEWQGQGNRDKSVSFLRGMNEKYNNSQVNFIVVKGCDLTTDNRNEFAAAIRAAKKADMVIAAMGESYNYTGESASRSCIKLPGVQQELLYELKQTGKPIGLVIFNGRPLDLSWEDENLDAILEVWYPGTMGGRGIADVIAGDYNPSGRLTMSFPRSIGQVPIYYNHKNTGRPFDTTKPKEKYRSSYIDQESTPLYPFGYGLSYSDFEISGINADSESMSKKGSITITASIRNISPYKGESVVQLYIRNMVSSVTRPVKELKGFKKIALEANESSTVSFTITSAELEFYGLNMTKSVESGPYKAWIAQNSADESNEIFFRVK